MPNISAKMSMSRITKTQIPGSPGTRRSPPRPSPLTPEVVALTSDPRSRRDTDRLDFGVNARRLVGGRFAGKRRPRKWEPPHLHDGQHQYPAEERRAGHPERHQAVVAERAPVEEDRQCREHFECARPQRVVPGPAREHRLLVRVAEDGEPCEE